MERVETGADLHLLGLVDGFAFGEDDAAVLKCRMTCRELVLDDEVLRLFCVDKRCNVGVLIGDDGFGVTKSCVRQHFCDIGIGSGRDLVDHGDRESDLGFIVQVSNEVRTDLSVCSPSIGDREDSRLQLVAVVRAVVHGDECQRECAGGETFVKQCGQTG